MEEIHNKFIKIYTKIKGAKNILILIHTTPDGDCIGASISLYFFLKNLGINANIFSKDKIPESFNFLNLVDFVYKFEPKTYDLFIILDANTLERCGVFEEISTNNTIIFDHHKKIGEGAVFEEVILSDKSSCCEIIFNFITFFDKKILPEISTALLMGILTDTSNFNNAATNIESVNISKELIINGAKLKEIQVNLFKNKDIKSLDFWGILFNRLKKNEKLSLAWTYFSKEDINSFNIKEDDVSSISNFMNNINDYNVGMVIKGLDNAKIKFSLRTTKNINLLKLANLFGGGGHKKACGFEIKGKIIESEGKIKII